MGFYSEFIQYCRICGQEMLVAIDGATGLHPGKARDAVCSEPCSQEFRRRQDRSASNTPQDLAAQKSWQATNSECHVSAVARLDTPLTITPIK